MTKKTFTGIEDHTCSDCIGYEDCTCGSANWMWDDAVDIAYDQATGK